MSEDQIRLLMWMEKIPEMHIPDKLSEDGEIIALDILVKLQDFKSWAESEIEKM